MRSNSAGVTALTGSGFVYTVSVPAWGLRRERRSAPQGRTSRTKCSAGAQHHRPHTEIARRAYLGPEDTTAVASDELLRRIEAGHTVVLDVRPDPEYAARHLPGALHVPLEQLAERLAELPTDRQIVAYCRGRYCVLAPDAVRLLHQHGITAQRAADGILEWKLAGLPMETAAG